MRGGSKLQILYRQDSDTDSRGRKLADDTSMPRESWRPSNPFREADLYLPPERKAPTTTDNFETVATSAVTDCSSWAEAWRITRRLINDGSRGNPGIVAGVAPKNNLGPVHARVACMLSGNLSSHTANRNGLHAYLIYLSTVSCFEARPLVSSPYVNIFMG